MLLILYVYLRESEKLSLEIFDPIIEPSLAEKQGLDLLVQR